MRVRTAREGRDEGVVAWWLVGGGVVRGRGGTAVYHMNGLFSGGGWGWGGVGVVG